MEAQMKLHVSVESNGLRKPGVAGYTAINSATLPPALISLNPLTAMKKLK
jgi:hypothetical protein